MYFNFGPETICYRHKDWGNLAFGICVVTNAGNFDPTCGGHLILWECGLVIEFPPGSSIMVPSAVISHSNIPIQPSETQYSFTQYAASGLFRWVEHGFQKEGRYNRDLSAEEQSAGQVHREKHKDLGLSLFSTMNELCGLPQKWRLLASNTYFNEHVCVRNKDITHGVPESQHRYDSRCLHATQRYD